MYNLMEIHNYALTMQKEMTREVESSNPKFIVLVPISTSWLIRPNSEKFDFELDRRLPLPKLFSCGSSRYNIARRYRLQMG